MPENKETTIRREIHRAHDDLVASIHDITELRNEFNSLDTTFGHVMDAISSDDPAEDSLDSNIPPDQLAQLADIRSQLNRLYDRLLVVTNALTGSYNTHEAKAELLTSLQFVDTLLTDYDLEQDHMDDCAYIIKLYDREVRPLINDLARELSEASGFVERLLLKSQSS